MAEPIPPSEWMTDVPFDSADYLDRPPYTCKGRKPKLPPDKLIGGVNFATDTHGAEHAGTGAKGGQFVSNPTGGQDVPTEGAQPSAPSPDAKADTLLRYAAKIPGKVMGRARDKVKTVYAGLSSRYGPGYAKAIVAAGLAGVAVPLPGASFVTAAPLVAVAELHKMLAGTVMGTGDDIAMTDEQVQELGRQLLAEVTAGQDEDDDSDHVIGGDVDKVEPLQLSTERETSHATETGKQQKDDQPEHQDGGQRRKTTKAGGRDRTPEGGQEQQEVARLATADTPPQPSIVLNPTFNFTMPVTMPEQPAVVVPPTQVTVQPSFTIPVNPTIVVPGPVNKEPDEVEFTVRDPDGSTRRITKTVKKE